MRAKEFTSEKINPDSLKSGFKQERDILNGQFRIVATGSDNQYGGALTITVFTNTDKPEEVGYAGFSVRERREDNEPHLRAGMIAISPRFRKLGIAKEIYKFANDIGNDIMPSTNQTDDGKAMWAGLQKHVRQPAPAKAKEPVGKPGFFDRIKKFANVTELFDPNKQWQWTFQDENQAIATFEIGGVPYKFFAAQDSDEAPGDWEIEFTANVADTGNATWGVTGTGNAAEVFGTVVDILKTFLADRKGAVRRLTFAAKEGSRQGLYARMVKRLLPDWDMVHHGESFTVTKQGLTFWVYSLEFPNVPAVKIKAKNSIEAQNRALKLPQFKNADLQGMVASATPPRR